ncbi:pyruvate kinase [Candidatus Uhrbacteria bacterium]|nr:pyruvate kinase [Candidatus Uhrbacteria bacterium]
MQTKRTKIVCTIGPSSHDISTMVELGQAGMDVARLNFSHGTHADHRRLYERLQTAGKQLGRPFTILQDLQGPKIRVGNLPKEGIKLVVGKSAIFSTSVFPKPGDIPVSLHRLHHDVKSGEHLLFDDGLLEVVVRKIDGARIHTDVIIGGTLFSHKGLNLPGTSLHIPALSKKDRDDVIFGASLGVDYVALSFVRSAEDVKGLRKLLLTTRGGKNTRIIAKIEKREALENFGKIVPFIDAVMVARGDLGIETPAAEVPVVQKQLIDACREIGKPVIVATQMLDSMQRNPRPTRAEVSDVANAVVDHADAVMLSGETAGGLYPVDSVKIMCETIRNMEATSYDNLSPLNVSFPTDEVHAFSLSTRLLVDALHLSHVVVSANDLFVRTFSSFRPEVQIHALTKDERLARQWRLSWGVCPHVFISKTLSPASLSKIGLKKGMLYAHIVEEKGHFIVEVKKA